MSIHYTNTQAVLRDELQRMSTQMLWAFRWGKVQDFFNPEIFVFFRNFCFVSYCFVLHPMLVRNINSTPTHSQSNLLEDLRILTRAHSTQANVHSLYQTFVFSHEARIISWNYPEFSACVKALKESTVICHQSLTTEWYQLIRESEWTRVPNLKKIPVRCCWGKTWIQGATYCLNFRGRVTLVQPVSRELYGKSVNQCETANVW